MIGTWRADRPEGRLFVQADATGAATWYGSCWAGPVRVKRLIGPKRRAGCADGPTCVQGEAELRRLISGDAGDRRRLGRHALGVAPPSHLVGLICPVEAPPSVHAEDECNEAEVPAV